MWPLVGGAALAVVIAAVVVVALRHGSVNQAQECSRDVYPYIEHSTIQGPGGGPGALPTTATGDIQWEVGRVRQAARKALSDPPLAKDLNTIVTALLMSDEAAENPGDPSKFANAAKLEERGFNALSTLCPLAGGPSDPGFTPPPPGSALGSLPQPSKSLSASQKAMCSALKSSDTPATGSSVADTLHLIAEKYRQAAQLASSDPPLARELNVVAAELQNMSTTMASGGSPTSAEEAQLSRDEGVANNALTALCG